MAANRGHRARQGPSFSFFMMGLLNTAQASVMRVPDPKIPTLKRHPRQNACNADTFLAKEIFFPPIASTIPPGFLRAKNGATLFSRDTRIGLLELFEDGREGGFIDADARVDHLHGHDARPIGQQCYFSAASLGELYCLVVQVLDVCLESLLKFRCS